MKIIVSPAKQMRVQTDIFMADRPVFMEDAKKLCNLLKTYSFAELKQLYGANDKITEQNYNRLKEMNLDGPLTPAVLAYVGLQYQSMAPDIFTLDQWEYVKKHLYILSGFYGILKAADGVVPYRLEMQAKLSIDGKKDLYAYWGKRLYEQLVLEGDRIIINLASKEYSKAIEPWLGEEDTFLTCIFGTETDGKVKVKATAAKMARGEMVRYLSEHQVDDVAEIKKFNRLGYTFRPEYSTDTEYVYTV